jgi:hypothetical protein
MSFRELMEKYRDGSATPEERELFERELEKYEALSEYAAEREDGELSIPAGEAEEAGRVSRAVRRRFRRAALLAAVLVLAVLAAVFGGLRLYEASCYDPNRGVAEKYGGDGQFMLDTAVCTELFSPGFITSYASAERTGPASYQVSVRQQNLFFGETETFTGLVSGGAFTDWNMVDRCFFRQPVVNALQWKLGNFAWQDTDGKISFVPPDDLQKQQEQELRELPESARVLTYFTFREDMPLGEFEAFYREITQQEKSTILYVAVRGGDGQHSVMGFEPTGTGIVLGDRYDEERYPALELSNHENPQSAEAWETHFTSMLSYLADREEFLSALHHNLNATELSYTLSYVEENGMQVYGFLMQSRPQDVLAVLEREEIQTMYVENARLSPLSH